MAASAQKKTTTKKNTGTSSGQTRSGAKKSSGSREAPARSAAQEHPRSRTAPKRHYPGVWAAVFLFAGLFCFIGYFPVDALLVQPVCGLLRGLIGYGYYVLPLALLGCCAAALLVRDGTMRSRCVCLLVFPVLLGALIHILAAPELYAASDRFSGLLKALYDSGKNLKSGGAVSGTLAWGGQRLLSVYLTLPLLIVGLGALLMGIIRLTPSALAAQLRLRREKREAMYEFPPEEPEEPEERPVLRRQDTAAETAAAARIEQQRAGRRSPHAIDVPLDGYEAEMQEEEEYARQGFFNATPRVKTPAQILEQQHGVSRPTRRKEPKVEIIPREELAEEETEASAAPENTAVPETAPVVLPEAAAEPADDEPPAIVHSPFGFHQKRPRKGSEIPPEETAPAPESEPPVPAPAAASPAQPAAAAAMPTADVTPLSPEEAADIAGVTLESPADPIKVEEFSSEVVRSIRANAKKGIDTEELINETQAVARAVVEKDAALASEPTYRFPPVELLRSGVVSGPNGQEEMRVNSERLQATLDSFGVHASICDVTRGPTVTRYDLELEAGVKLAKLTNLAGDLALALGVTGVRIAPIPDRISTVGVEVPNRVVSTVYLRDIIDTDTFRKASSRLTFALGKDIGGNAIVGNIAKLPHLLIAGTTGSGKSVCMNCLILSLLYKATPEEVRLIMIDPKMVELGIYNGIPHLYIPVVTDPKKAAGSLQWAVVEMLKRYRLFSEAGIRDLAGYNAIKRKNGEPTLPQVVIVIDELADLMMVASKEVEESICRVAQMGRAAGMHLVIATQRPSADVITGLMKANIPSRIAFAVSSGIESRIILDQQGAEKLIGSGDMLYAPIGIGKPNRIQGAFVTDEEREEIVTCIKQNGEPNYSEEIMHSIELAAAEKDGKGGGSAHAESVEAPPEPASSYDELLPQAAEVIFETKQASVSMLQRRLKLGYSRAARIVDQLEEVGVVGPFEGSKPRQILITREQWLEMQTVQGTAPTEKVQDENQLSFSDLQESFQDAPPEEWTD